MCIQYHQCPDSIRVFKMRDQFMTVRNTIFIKSNLIYFMRNSVVAVYKLMDNTT